MLLSASTVLLTILAYGLILLPAYGESARTDGLTLSQDGVTRYRVVIATEADAPTKAAAEEMLSYIEQTQDEQSYQLGPEGQALQPPEAPVAVGVPERIDRGRLWYLRSERIRNAPGLHGDFITAPAIKPAILKQWDAAFERMEQQVANGPTLLLHVQAERVTVLWCCLLYLPPEDPVRIKAQKLWLPTATKEAWANCG